MPDPRFPFSNFQLATIHLDGQACRTVEHAFQAAKTLDPTERAWVIEAKTPGEAKKRGRKVTLRPDWDEIKGGLMLGLLRQKFAPGTDNPRKLLAFEDRIVEYTIWHDLHWGVCTCPRHRGQGLNMLGRLLTALRQELLAQAAREGVAEGPVRDAPVLVDRESALAVEG
jgi:N-glycosidase YbiA